MHDIESFFSVREAAWHSLGSVLPSHPKSVDEVLTAAGLDWTVGEYPVLVQGPNGQIEAPDRKGIVRESDNSLLSIMSGSYQPIQPRQLVEFAFGLLDVTESEFELAEGEPPILFETGMSLADGKVNVLLTRIPKDIQIGGFDTVELYLAFCNSHDGSYKFSVHATPVRVVCRNTLNSAIKGAVQSFSTKHTSGALNSIDEARRALQLTWKYADAFEDSMNRLLDTEYTRRDFETLVRDLFPKPAGERAPFSREQYGILGLLESSPTINDEIRATKYGAYNAVLEWADWGSRYNEGGASVEEKRTISQLFGRAKTTADKTLAYLS